MPKKKKVLFLGNSYPAYNNLQQLIADVALSAGHTVVFSSNTPAGYSLFYMTWGSKNGDAFNCATCPPVCTCAGMDSLLRLR